MISLKSIFALAGITVAGFGAFYLLRAPEMPQASAAAPSQAAFVLPEFSDEAAEGERYFTAVCADCHGQNGLGTEQGPPLIHDIYNPGHHGDRAFLRAVNDGVPQHHWPFGNMPPQALTRAEVARIVTYIRELQVANGITYRPHNM